MDRASFNFGPIHIMVLNSFSQTGFVGTACEQRYILHVSNLAVAMTGWLSGLPARIKEVAPECESTHVSFTGKCWLAQKYHRT